jgi:hypothetical protein
LADGFDMILAAGASMAGASTEAAAFDPFRQPQATAK